MVRIWNAMELMGRYAAANHACSPRHIAENLGAQVLLDLENHHNFAWKERHVIGGVERESSFIARAQRRRGRGCWASFPARWPSPGFVVSGKGNAESLNLGLATARPHDESQSREREVQLERCEPSPARARVTLISAGLDESADGLQNIREVMAAQSDLVTVLGEFNPKLVKMAPAASGRRIEEGRAGAARRVTCH